MVDLNEFRGALLEKDATQIVEDYVLGGDHAHVTSADVEYIEDTLAANYRVAPEAVRVVITGSAHLGFSLVEKIKDGTTFPRYRPFSAMSDIDVAVISPAIQKAIWIELSSHQHRAVWFPKPAGKLGDYLTAGWFRPDHFPRDLGLLACREWPRTFHRMSADLRFRRHEVKGGLFASEDHLKQYALRAVRDCIAHEVSP